jgi:hypothetical protein
MGGSSPGRSWEFFSSPPRPDQLWDPPGVLSNGYQGLLPGSKAARSWSWPLTGIYFRGQECVELYLHSTNKPSWCGAELMHRDNFTYLLHAAEHYLKSWESLSLSKNVLLFIWNPEVQYRVHKSPSLDPILSQPNPVLPIDPYIPKV